MGGETKVVLVRNGSRKRGGRLLLTGMDKLENGYRYRDPAPQTLKFMDEQRDFNKKVDLAMNDMKHDIKDIADLVRITNEQNTCQHKEIMDRIGRIEQFAIGILVIFAMAAVYFIFSKVGLKIP
jgi:hypothetical protein